MLLLPTGSFLKKKDINDYLFASSSKQTSVMILLTCPVVMDSKGLLKM